MTMKSLMGTALLLCVASAAPSLAEEKADRLVTTFAKVCLAKPASVSAMNKLAVAQGFTLDKAGAAALAKADNGQEDPFNLLLFWNVGTDDARMRVTALISGTVDRHELGCIVDGYNVPPQDVLAALKPVLGEPTGRNVKENNWTEVTWKAGGDAVRLSFKDGMPRVSLTLVQMLGKAAAKP